MSQAELNILLFLSLFSVSFIFEMNKDEWVSEEIIFTLMCNLVFIKIFVKWNISPRELNLYGQRNYYQFNQHANACCNYGGWEFSRLLCRLS